MSKAKKFLSASDLWVERGRPAPTSIAEAKSEEIISLPPPNKRKDHQIETESGMGEVESLYRRARFQKLYGEDPVPELKFPRTLSSKLAWLHHKCPNEVFQVVAVFMLKDDLGNINPGKSSFLQSISTEVFFTESLSMNYSLDKLILTLKTYSRSLHRVITTLPKAHIIQVRSFSLHDSSRKLFGFFENSALIADQVAGFLSHDFTNMFP
ncbi:MAG: hypothetical protein KAR20_18295, partial [Candidatus Heimdallarchaeota archaeon]|nr:hypothetical protein [Candidatus Heimdallarchaeota archaeon]